MNKIKILNNEYKDYGEGFAPTNIALCKYWGKRQDKYNLPATGSISVSVPNKGARTRISILTNKKHDIIMLYNKLLDNTDKFAIRLSKFLDLFRNNNTVDKNYFNIETYSDIPIAAGLASSACGFAATVLALNDLFDWQLPKQKLSILARIGSGSAARSLWNGFVIWHKGVQEDGEDSFASSMDLDWPEFGMGVILTNSQEKKISSREAMDLCRKTSPYYNSWIQRSDLDFIKIKLAIENKNFTLLGKLAEENSQCMHACMQASSPSIEYSMQNTILNKHKVWKAREQGLEVYFTQDAGPNIKLLYNKQDLIKIRKIFTDLKVLI